MPTPRDMATFVLTTMTTTTQPITFPLAHARGVIRGINFCQLEQVAKKVNFSPGVNFCVYRYGTWPRNV